MKFRFLIVLIFLSLSFLLNSCSTIVRKVQEGKNERALIAFSMQALNIEDNFQSNFIDLCKKYNIKLDKDSNSVKFIARKLKYLSSKNFEYSYMTRSDNYIWKNRESIKTGNEHISIHFKEEPFWGLSSLWDYVTDSGFSMGFLLDKGKIHFLNIQFYECGSDLN